MSRRVLASIAFVLLLAPIGASAQGFEYGVQGARALGRGGAFAARADDPTILGINPAGLIEVPGLQIVGGSHMAFMDACLQRPGTYNNTMPDGAAGSTTFGLPDPGTPSNWVNQPMPLSCNSGYPGPSPNVILSWHPHPDWAVALGVLAPAGVGNATFGNPNGSSTTPNGTLVPSPGRYGLVQEDLLLFYPTLGVAWRPLRWLRLGVAFEAGVALVRFVNFASSGLANAATEDPGQDVRTELNIAAFVPAVVGSVHIVPTDSIDIVLHTRISDGIHSSGTLGVTTGVFGNDTIDGLRPLTTTINNAQLNAGQPWQFGIALRYGDRIRERPENPVATGRLTGRVEDHMQRENWDIELDAVYQLNQQVTDFAVSLPTGSQVGICTGQTSAQCMATGATLQAPLQTALPIPHGWQDQLLFRLGGDINILPGVFALRGGASFSTSGLSGRYQTQDFIPGMRLGFYLGATLRIEHFDVSFAYGHIFQFDETVTAANANFRAIAATGMAGQCTGDPVYNPGNPVTSRGCYPAGYGPIVNAGLYTAEFNVVSLQLGYHFE